MGETNPEFRPETLEHFSSAFRSDSRILITGASGWIGRTLALMCEAIQIPTILTASRARTETVGNRTLRFEEMNLSSAAAFKPTVVFDAAFITPEHLPRLGLNAYLGLNLDLISMSERLAHLESVRSVIFCGSGAGVQRDASMTIETDPYGYLKRETELRGKSLHDATGKQTVIMRPWSVSGVYCTKKQDYAFSSFIYGAINRRILVTGKSPTLRRYVSLEDLLAVSIFSAVNESGCKLVESGGELIELEALAKRIAYLAHWDVEIESLVDHHQPIVGYHSDNKVWEEVCIDQNFVEESLDSQILRNLDYAVQKARNLNDQSHFEDL